MSAAIAGRPSTGAAKGALDKAHHMGNEASEEISNKQQYGDSEISSMSSVLTEDESSKNQEKPSHPSISNNNGPKNFRDRAARVSLGEVKENNTRGRYQGETSVANVPPKFHEPKAQLKGPRDMPSRNYASQGRPTKDQRDWASDRSPLQKLEVTLGDMSKEDKRTRARDAETRLKERLLRQKAQSANSRAPASRPQQSSRELPTSRELPKDITGQPPASKEPPAYSNESRKRASRTELVQNKPPSTNVGYVAVNPASQPQYATTMEERYPPTPAEIMAKIPRRAGGPGGQRRVSGMDTARNQGPEMQPRRAPGSSRQPPPSFASRSREEPEVRRTRDKESSRQPRSPPSPSPPSPKDRSLGPETQPLPTSGSAKQAPLPPPPPPPPVFGQRNLASQTDLTKNSSRGMVTQPLPVVNVSSVNVAERDFAAMPPGPEAPPRPGLSKGISDQRMASQDSQGFRPKPKKQNVNVSFNVPPPTPPPLYEWKNAPVARLGNSEFTFQNVDIGGRDRPWWDAAGPLTRRESRSLPKTAYQTPSQQTFCKISPLIPFP